MPQAARRRRPFADQPTRLPSEPAIITVGLTKNPKTKAELDHARLWNWDPGAVHDVCFLGQDPDDPDKILIGEPEFGLEHWRKYSLDVLFKGVAIYFEK